MKYIQNISFLLIIILSCFHLGCSGEEDYLHIINPDDKNEWALFWSDEFNYTNREELLNTWQSQNGNLGSPNVLSSHWEENIEVGNGIVRLVAHKENRLRDLKWTGGSMWTKEKFQYGYFECRYKYAAATATNNSFWLMPDMPGRNMDYEIDINEGHYSNKVNTNIHIRTSEGSIKTYPTTEKYSSIDFSKDFHLFGLEWTEKELIFYLDRKEIRRIKNVSCFSETSLILSLAIITWAGPVTDAIDGKYMEVDYLRVYKPLNNLDNKDS